MNKQKFLELMKVPEKMSDTDFVALERLTNENPYFQNGHSVLARASRSLKKKSSGKKMSTAAIYATHRNRFKQYIQGQIKFALQEQKSTQKTAAPVSKPQITTAPRKAHNLRSESEQSQLINEIYANLEKWKASRDQYLEFDKNHPEDIIIEEVEAVTPEPAPFLPVNESKKEAPIVEADKIDPVEQLKNQVVEEIEAEEESISLALSGLTEEKTPQSPPEKEVANSPTFSATDEPEPATAEESEEIDRVIKPEVEITEEPIQETENETISEPAEEIESETITAKTEGPISDDMEISSDELSAIVDAIANGEEEQKKDSKSDAKESPTPAVSPQSKKEASLDEIEKLLEERATEEKAESESSRKPSVQADEKSVAKVDANKEDINLSNDSEDEEILPQATMSIAKDESSTEEVTSEVVEEKETYVPLESSKSESNIDLDIAIDNDKSKEETEEELHKIEEEIHELKLNLNASRKKKTWRLGMLKHGTPFTKPAKKKEPISKPEPAKAIKEVPKSKKPTTKPKKKAETEISKTKEKKTKPKFKLTASISTKKVVKKKKPTDDEKENSVKKKVKKTINRETSPETDNQKSIIDDFIETNPSIVISKEKRLDHDPIEDLAMANEAFPDELVTENLATILTKQGKISKAMVLYEKLILKNPQKKAYFASQIEILKKK